MLPGATAWRMSLQVARLSLQMVTGHFILKEAGVSLLRRLACHKMIVFCEMNRLEERDITILSVWLVRENRYPGDSIGWLLPLRRRHATPLPYTSQEYC
jgi:hypothetical protein